MAALIAGFFAALPMTEMGIFIRNVHWQRSEESISRLSASASLHLKRL